MEQYLEVQMKANPIPVKDTIDIVTGNRKIQYTDFVIKELGGEILALQEPMSLCMKTRAAFWEVNGF